MLGMWAAAPVCVWLLWVWAALVLVFRGCDGSWPVLWAAEFLYVCVWPGLLWLVCVCVCVCLWFLWLLCCDFGLGLAGCSGCVCVCLMLIWVWTSSLPEEWLWPFHGNKTLTAIQTRTHKDGSVKIVLSWFKLGMDFGGIFWCSFWQGQYVENGFFDCYWEGA